MLKLSHEAKVGLLVLIGVGLLAYMSLKVGGGSFGSGDGYELSVKFDTAAGLDKGGSVQIAGVEVGRIMDILLEDNKAKVILKIKREISIGKDFVAVLTTRGILGEKYIELIPGTSNAPLIESGGEITRTTKYSDINRLLTVMTDVAEDFKGISRSLNAVLGGKEGERTMKNIVTNLEELTYRANRIIALNEEKFSGIMNNFDVFSGTLREEVPHILYGMNGITEAINKILNENKGDLREGISNLKLASIKLQQTMDTIDDLVKDIKPKMNESLESINSIATKIDKGDGTIGKLLNDSAIHDNLNEALTGVNQFIGKVSSLKIFLGYRGEYLTDLDYTKSYISLKLQPKADKYYLIEIIDDPKGDQSIVTTDVTVGGITTTRKEVTTTDSFKFSVQLAKTFNDLSIRGGIIESTGGLGMDYFLMDDKIKVTFEAFNFDTERRPHLKAGLTYNMGRYFFVTGGYDDFISDVNLDSYYIGGGFRFEDEDIKYFLGSIPVTIGN